MTTELTPEDIERIVRELRMRRTNDAPRALSWSRRDCEVVVEAANLIEKLTTPAELSPLPEGCCIDACSYCNGTGNVVRNVHGDFVGQVADFTPITPEEQQREERLWVFEHEDGRVKTGPAGADFLKGDPKWHRVGPVEDCPPIP